MKMHIELKSRDVGEASTKLMRGLGARQEDEIGAKWLLPLTMDLAVKDDRDHVYPVPAGTQRFPKPQQMATYAAEPFQTVGTHESDAQGGGHGVCYSPPWHSSTAHAPAHGTPAHSAATVSSLPLAA